MRYLVLSSILFILFSIILSAQTIKKQVKATRIISPPKIDGVLDEAIWESAFTYTSDFTEVSSDKSPFFMFSEKPVSHLIESIILLSPSKNLPVSKITVSLGYFF